MSLALHWKRSAISFHSLFLLFAAYFILYVLLIYQQNEAVRKEEGGANGEDGDENDTDISETDEAYLLGKATVSEVESEEDGRKAPLMSIEGRYTSLANFESMLTYFFYFILSFHRGEQRSVWADCQGT